MPNETPNSMQAEAAGRKQVPGYYRFKLGSFEAIAVHDGVVVRDRPSGFVRNASEDAVSEALAEIGLPVDKLTLTFTALAIDTGKQIVLIDAGFGDSGAPTTGKLLANLEAAGIAVGDVGTVIVSHFHGDHINGLRTKDGAPVFPNAEIAVPEKEWAFWMDEARADNAPEGMKPAFAGARRIFEPIAADVRRFAWGDEVLPGFRAVEAAGHTPGHTAITIESGSDRMMFAADITNNPALFARHPEWQAVFDMDGQKAVETRRRLLDMAATEKLRLSFFHAAFPATGYVIRSGTGYEFVPAMWRGDV